MRILLAEDDAMIGQAIHDALRDAALTVDWVRDGATALSTLGHQRYDALLLDRARTGSPCCTACARAAARCRC